MARKKAESIRTKPTGKVRTVKPASQSLFDYFRFGESYTSLILGMVVIIIIAILLTALLRSRNFLKTELTTDTSSTSTSKEAETESSNTHTVASGETLWTISEKYYQSGYNWIDIAKANKIENADAIEEGVKLTIPKVEAKVVTVAEESSQPNAPNAISGTTYTVQQGDTLWNIAERAYGDGYKWIAIAQANNIPNPDLIYSGTVLQISR